jgi:alpha-1,2-mannosyltransferase
MTRSITRVFFAATAGIVAGVALVTAAVGCGAPLALAVGIALLGASGGGWLAARSKTVGDVAALPPPVLGLGAVGMTVALVELVRLAVFMIDPAQVAWSVQPGNTWRVRHSCVSAYWVACQEVDDVADVYRLQRYEPPRDAAGRRQRIVMEGFVLDAYEYPPPFLVLPRLLAHGAPTFLRFRTLWFAVQLIVVAAGLVVVASHIGGVTGAYVVALSGFVLAPYGIVTTLQIGNAQLAFVTLPMVAMVLFDRRRPVAGGALLAYATVSKLYPALLVLYLLLRRDWRGAAWTVGLGALIVALSVADIGWTPYLAFIDHLPRLLSGEAFPAMALPEGMALNQSIPGLPLKLALFGLAPATLAWARVAGWLYTPLLLWATVRLARGRFDREDEPLAWLTVVLLATYRSTFLPQYGVFPGLWLVVLLAARFRDRPVALAALAGAWAVLTLNFAGWPGLAMLNGIVTTAQTLTGLALAFVVLQMPAVERRAVGAVEASAPASSPAPA